MTFCSIVSDPVKASFYSELWLERARTNTEAYDDAFAVVPTDRVKVASCHVG